MTKGKSNRSYSYPSNRSYYESNYLQEKSVTTALPKVLMSLATKQKLDAYISACSIEISGIGIVDRVGQDYLITDFLIFKQKCSAAATDLDQLDLGKFAYEAVLRGINSKLKCWWHSHAGMGVFWSGTDQNTARGFGNDWMVSLVSNHRHEYLARLDIFGDTNITLDKLVVEIQYPNLLDAETIAAIQAEVLQKVEKISYTYSYPPGNAVIQPGRFGQYEQELAYDPELDPDYHLNLPADSGQEIELDKRWSDSLFPTGFGKKE